MKVISAFHFEFALDNGLGEVPWSLLERQVGYRQYGYVHVDRYVLEVSRIESRVMAICSLREHVHESLGNTVARNTYQSTNFVMHEADEDALVTNGDETNGMPARPMWYPALPIHILRIMHIAHDLELVIGIASLPRVTEGVMPIRQASCQLSSMNSKHPSGTTHSY